MEYSILNNYTYTDKTPFLTACDWLSQPLRVALGGRTIQLPSKREQQDDRIRAIALCCLVFPVVVGAMGLLLKSLSCKANLIDKMSAASLVSIISDRPFVNVYFPPLLALTFEQEQSPVSEDFINSFIKHLFEEFQEEQSSEKRDILLDPDGEIFIQGSTRKTLKEVIQYINWGNLESRWRILKNEKLERYIQKSLLFEKLRDHTPDMISIFHRPNPFIYLYTSKGFYAIVNSLLRRGKLQDGRLAYASQATNDRLAQNDQQVICKIVKEVLFVSLMTAGSLSALPDRYLATERVVRIAHVPQAVLAKMNEKQIIADRGFLSASAAGGGFAGGGPCDELSFRVKYVIKSKKGKHVSSFSELPENEVLFGPCSQFRISKRTGSEQS